MDGILLVNHFLKTNKYNELHNHLLKSARECGIKLKLKTNLELMCNFENSDFVLFWDKDINLARLIEKKGIPVFNSSEAIAKCDDKARTYIELLGAVPQPKTIIAPKSYFSVNMDEFIYYAISKLGLPLVFKECFGSFGEQVFLCRSYEEIVSHISNRPFILQEFIEESQGKDVRIEVVGDKCVCAVQRENKNDFRSNVTNGGTMTPYTPTEFEKKIAVDACNALGLTFAGVDIINHNAVCEVNSNAHIINIMNTTRTDIAPIIFNQILREL